MAGDMTEHMDLDAELSAPRIKRQVCLALVVSSVIPLLLLAWALYGHVIPLLDPVRHAGQIAGAQAMLAFTTLLIIAGAFIIWDLAIALTHRASMSAVARHAEEVDQFARRLERAYADLEETNARLKEASFKDDVSGLYNRRFFSVRLEEEIARYQRFNHPVSVVLLDLDRFKELNDELGHAAGDEALRVVGEALVAHSRGINVICRYGGDEFAVLLVETPKSGAECYAERIRSALADHRFAHGRPVTASFGVAALPEDVGLGGDLVRAADTALYDAKRAGRNQVCAYQGSSATTVQGGSIAK
jgi:diguanylate cyclase (GGDEF)-like protein